MPGGLHPPLELYHAWQTDQFPHGERRDWSIVIIVTLFGVLAYATVAARLWARVMVNRNSGLDDALIVVALVCRLEHRWSPVLICPDIYLWTCNICDARQPTVWI
ncbi:hypothetical protein IWX92DRAFT_195210 [Phyllosticta citricarpa]